jgi:RNA polymerase sigma-70 factor (ECF subfamily)
MGNILQFFSSAVNPQDFEVMLKPHIETLYKLGWRFTGKQADAEDLVQGFLLKLFIQQDKLQNVEELKPWLARSFYNYFVSEYRKFRRDPLKSSEELENNDSLINEADPGKEEEQASTGRRIMELVHLLPMEQRTIIVMHDMEGYALQEIADITCVPLGTVKSRLCRAREKLKKTLQTEPWQDLLRDSE